MTLADRLESVRSRIATAARIAGRDPAEIELIVVTKNHSAELVRDLAQLGVRDVAENRHQEAVTKAARLADLGLRWHFVGQLQTNKAGQVLAYSRSIHSVDRIRLLDALARTGLAADVFLEVNLTDDTTRGGCHPADLATLAEACLQSSELTLRGVMAVAPRGEDPGRAFARLRDFSNRVREVAPDARAISAGMSQDFEYAIAEGATHLRIGAAITGNRPLEG